MNFRVDVYVMPLKDLLDPQGKTVMESLQKDGMPEVKDVRIGKLIRMMVEAKDETEVVGIIDRACQSMLYNPVMEEYSYEIYPLEN